MKKPKENLKKKNNVPNQNLGDVFKKSMKTTEKKIVKKIKRTIERKKKELVNIFGLVKNDTIDFLIKITPSLIRIVLAGLLIFISIPIGIYLNLIMTFFQYSLIIQSVLLFILGLIIIFFIVFAISLIETFLNLIDNILINNLKKQKESMSDTNEPTENVNNTEEIKDDIYKVLTNYILIIVGVWLGLLLLIFLGRSFLPNIFLNNSTRKINETIKLIKNLDKKLTEHFNLEGSPYSEVDI